MAYLVNKTDVKCDHEDERQNENEESVRSAGVHLKQIVCTEVRPSDDDVSLIAGSAP